MGAPRMTLNGTSQAQLSIVATRRFDSDLVTGTVPFKLTTTQTVSSIATTITCDLLWQGTRTIAGGAAAIDIDLNDAVACSGLMEFFNEDDGSRNAIFDRVHFLYIRNTTTGAAAGESVLRVGGDANPFPWFFTTPATDTIDIAPNAFVNSSAGVDAGWAVVAGATDVLQIANLDGVNDASYEIVIIGESTQSVATTTTTTAAATTTTTAAATTTTTAAATTTTTAAPTTTTP